MEAFLKIKLNAVKFWRCDALNAYAFQFLDNTIDSKEKLADPENKFAIKKVSTETMEKLIEWMKFHIGECFLKSLQ